MSIFSVELADSEIDALINWHLDQKYECANKEEYNDAEYHRKRALELQKTVTLRAAEKSAASMT